MIRITDMTLSSLDIYDPTGEHLRELCALLVLVRPDYIELSVDAFHKIGTLPEGGNYILRCDTPADIQRYPNFSRYVCRKSGKASPPNVVNEIQANDICEINFLNQFFSLENVRIRGLDDIIAHDYQAAFEVIRKTVKGSAQLCPENKYHCATAIAVEWVLGGGKEVAVSFAGVGGFAAIEEVLMALRLEIRHRPGMDFTVYPKIREQVEQITGRKFSLNKPVIGANIFNMEAGIHADGIQKDPTTYEPYKPELVGNTRRLIIGKHSGKNAILLKLRELGLDIGAVNVENLLKTVRVESVKKQQSLTDEEFVDLYHHMS